MAVELSRPPETILAELARAHMPRGIAEGCTLIGVTQGQTVRRLMSARDLKDEYGLDPKTLADWEERKAFPIRRQVSPITGGKIAWDRGEVEEWWANRPRGIAGSKSAQEQEK